MLPLKTDKPLFYYHLPKTGGESLSEILSSLYLPQQVMQVSVTDQKVTPFNFVHPQVFSQVYASKLSQNVRLISGHVMPWYHPAFDAKVMHRVVLLRDPIDRMLSAFYYTQQKHGYPESLESIFSEDDPLIMFSNPMTRLFSGVPSVDGSSLSPRLLSLWESGDWGREARVSQHALSDLEFKRACENLESFEFIGRTDQFDSLLERLSRAFQIPAQACRYARKNVTQSRVSVEGISSDLRKKIEDENAYDIELFQHACKVIDRNKPTTQVSFSAMKERPFFSVIIPTRNRPAYAKKAVRSVLIQKETDFEIVLVDNNEGNSGPLTFGRIDDPRLNYIRTGELTMPENWELSFQQAQGKYILLLPDRDVLTTPGALSTLRQIIEQTGAKFVSYNWATEAADGTVQKRAYDNKVHKLASISVIKSLLKGNYRAFADLAPKALNSCVSREVLSKIRESNGPLCPPLSPDYTIACQQLMAEPEYFYFNAPVFTQTGEAISHGSSVSKSASATKASLAAFGVTESESVAYSPSKLILQANTFYSDLFRLASRLKWPVSWDHLDYSGYFYLLAENIERRARYGEDIQELWSVWLDDVRRLAPDRANEIIEKAKGMGLLREVCQSKEGAPLRIEKPVCLRLPELYPGADNTFKQRWEGEVERALKVILSEGRECLYCSEYIQQLSAGQSFAPNACALVANCWDSDSVHFIMKLHQQYNVPITLFLSLSAILAYVQNEGARGGVEFGLLCSVDQLSASKNIQADMQYFRDGKTYLDNRWANPVNLLSVSDGCLDIDQRIALRACGYSAAITNKKMSTASELDQLLLNLPSERINTL